MLFFTTRLCRDVYSTFSNMCFVLVEKEQPILYEIIIAKKKMWKTYKKKVQASAKADHGVTIKKSIGVDAFFCCIFYKFVLL